MAQGDTYAHQDWTTVVFKKRPTVQTEQRPRTAPSSGATGAFASSTNKSKNASLHSATAKPAWKVEQMVDDVTSTKPPVPKVSKEDRDEVIRLRVAKKLTQDQLATRLNMRASEIKDIERGTAVENKNVINRIKRFLQS